MGIHGIYQEIGKGERISFLKYAVQTYEKEGRPLRIAIDVSIWLFQIQASKGGTNPALRTFYYRLLRLTSHGIHPIFVFDGPNKPPFKRNKRTGPNVASIPEFLAKQLLKMFGFPIHMAPGEAEAECALLQREGIVDSVLTEDVDALMFGSGITLRSWSPEQKSSKVPTHINLYDAKKIKSGPSGLDREGMILVALMSGGDYIPEGIPGCGPKTACEAARAGFGQDLCRLKPSDKVGLNAWRKRLNDELHMNNSKIFKRKHKTLTVPDEFPRADIMGYYTNPVISSAQALERLKLTLRWDHDVDFPSLREFTGDAFAWVKLEGAKHFIRSLAPAMLVRELRIRAARCDNISENMDEIEKEESRLITSLHNERKHTTTDLTSEIRVGFVPLEIVRIDLHSEEADDTIVVGDSDIEEEAPLFLNADDAPEPTAAPKTRGPTKYDPTMINKAWIPDTFVRIGVPLKIEDWEGSKRTATEQQRMRQTAKDTRKTQPRAKKSSSATGGMRGGELYKFAKQTKPGSRPPPASKAGKAIIATMDHPDLKETLPLSTAPQLSVISLLSSPPTTPRKSRQSTIDRYFSPRSDARCIDTLAPSIESKLETSDEFAVQPRKKRSGFQRTQTLPTHLESSPRALRASISRGERRSYSPDPQLPSPGKFRSKRSKPSSAEEVIRQRRSIEGLDLCATTSSFQRISTSAHEPSGRTLRIVDLASSSPVQPPSRVIPSFSNSVVPMLSPATPRDPVTFYSSPPASPILDIRTTSPYLDSIKETSILNRHQGWQSPDLIEQDKNTKPQESPLTPPITTPARSPSDQQRIPDKFEDPFGASPKVLKQFIRPREDLPGHFAWTDGTSPEALRWMERSKLLQNVRMVDLTASPSHSTSTSVASRPSGPASKTKAGSTSTRTRSAVNTRRSAAECAPSQSQPQPTYIRQPVSATASPLVRGTKRSKRIARRHGVAGRGVSVIDLTL
ncbi:hypothetical protein EJ05DRAFT_485587 [Pseudovirgaria hyperparasitica]|uniref:XPG-I domain-containing protein n=1 Tax=Pseudovirgaria hyperparasitica TaxID=470096 RepID=A0A6A6W947_9PEZI|nr:uncharacterized protein EJ05DRAFT_485587 [Pseudovirgaria hyperparasitica]KAF2758460.1 hypothetical protein EJ05DRAFT_485587 [Pseudovirgaria hyperparasitica]